MSLFVEGIKVGLILCFLIGPIFFAIIQAGVEEGFRAGAMVGLGIWLSDLLFIGSVYLGLSFITKLIAGPSFPLYLGIGGSITLVGFGLGALLTMPQRQALPEWSQKALRTSSYKRLWLKGFLINTLNPFTFFFWIGIASTVVVEGGLQEADARYFFAGILLTIIVTDLTKVLLAKRIRRVLRPIHLLWLRRISGAALILFGIALFGRVLWGMG